MAAMPVRYDAALCLKIEKGPFATNGEVHRPEYETIAALGNMCLNDNMESVIKANELCNTYGMDTMAVGAVIAFAMECYEKGIITRKDTDGIELTWGNGAAVVAVTEKMGKREGFGAVLADGVAKAAERIGKGSEAYAMHVGGHRLPYHDARNNPALGTNMISDAQPACHMEVQGSGRLNNGAPLGADPCCNSPSWKRTATSTKKALCSSPVTPIFSCYHRQRCALSTPLTLLFRWWNCWPRSPAGI